MEPPAVNMDSLSSGPLRILFVCQKDLRIASEKQALGFAGALQSRGNEVRLSLFGDPSTHAAEHLPIAEKQLLYRHWLGPFLSPRHLRIVRQFSPDLIHVFNPRSVTVRTARQIVRVCPDATVVVHWEDDEEGMREGVAVQSSMRRVGRRMRRLARYVAPQNGVFVTDRSLDWVRRRADRCDALTAGLRDHVQATLDVPTDVVRPISYLQDDLEAPGIPSPPPEFGPRWKVAYTGTLHSESLEDFRIACVAVEMLRERGIDAGLVHAGRCVRSSSAEVARRSGLDDRSFWYAGYLAFHAVNELLRWSDVLIQPGRNNRFNTLRLPSKVHSYLASGTPTIMFAVGLGELLEDRSEVVKLFEFEAKELALRIEEIISAPDYAARLGAGGRRAADRLFAADRNSMALEACFRRAQESRLAAESS